MPGVFNNRRVLFGVLVVAGLVAVRIVDLLQAVHVECDDRVALTVARRERVQQFQFLTEEVPVVQPGEAVRRGLALRGLEHAAEQFPGCGELVVLLQQDRELDRFFQRQLDAVAAGRDPVGVVLDESEAMVDFEAGNYLE